MRLIPALTEIKSELVTSAGRSIIKSVIKTWDNCRRRGQPPDVPDYIASFVLNGAKYMDHEWRDIFGRHNIDVSVTGIYCHRPPEVRFEGMAGNSCRIGDLLWCHFLYGKEGNIERNAILYQTLIMRGQPHIIKKPDDTLSLYTGWPRFSYTGPGVMDGIQRDVKSSAPKCGARFMLIDGRAPEEPVAGIVGEPGTYPFGSCIADNPLVNHADLAYEITSTLDFLSGDTFAAKETAALNGWSEMLWDLIDLSTERAYDRKRSGQSSEPRSGSAAASDVDGCFYLSAGYRGGIFSKLTGDIPDSKPHAEKRQGGRTDHGAAGISLIIVESTEQ